jgi:HSP20 family protein
VIRWSDRPSVFDRLFNELFETSFGERRQPLAAPVDVHLSANEVTVEASLPGFRPDEVDLRVEDSVLTIQATHQGEQEHPGEDCLRHERYWGSVHRQVMLPRGVRPEAATATFENGVLRLRLPVAERPVGQRIAITPGEARQGPLESRAEQPAAEAQQQQRMGGEGQKR